MLAHASDPGTYTAEAGGLLQFKANLDYEVTLEPAWAILRDYVCGAVGGRGGDALPPPHCTRAGARFLPWKMILVRSRGATAVLASAPARAPDSRELSTCLWSLCNRTPGQGCEEAGGAAHQRSLLIQLDWRVHKPRHPDSMPPCPSLGSPCAVSSMWVLGV